MGKKTDRKHFFILGAARCGTTSLYNYLNQHKRICMSVPKEPGYFDRKIYEQKDYRFYKNTYFDQCSNEVWFGDATPHNLYVPHAAPRIRNVCPNAKLIVLVRNAVARAYSEWKVERLAGEDLAFEPAIKKNLDRLKKGITFEGDEGKERWYEARVKEYTDNATKRSNIMYRTYLDRGYYLDQLQHLLNYFDSGQIQVIPFNEINRDPQQVVTRVCNFLDIDTHNIKDTKSFTNQSYKSKYVERLVKLVSKTPLTRFAPRQWRSVVKSYLSSVGQTYRVNRAFAHRLFDHFRTKNDGLESFIKESITWNVDAIPLE